MKHSKLIILAGAAALFCACIPSVNPYFTDNDLVQDQRLVGEWREKTKPEEAQVWKFETGDNKAYKLSITEKDNKQGQLDAHLFKIKGELFLDVRPLDLNYATNQADLVGFCMIPGHLVFYVAQLEPTLKLASFDFDWLDRYLKSSPQSLAHRSEGDKETIITATTADLQKFLLQHLKDGLFKEPTEMERFVKTDKP